SSSVSAGSAPRVPISSVNTPRSGSLPMCRTSSRTGSNTPPCSASAELAAQFSSPGPSSRPSSVLARVRLGLGGGVDVGDDLLHHRVQPPDPVDVHSQLVHHLSGNGFGGLAQLSSGVRERDLDDPLVPHAARLRHVVQCFESYDQR